MAPVPTPATRTAYQTETPRRVTTTDPACAVFLHARNHAVLHVSYGRQGKLVYFFGADAEDDLELFFAAKDHVRALTERAQPRAQPRWSNST